jgi:Putative MetA-pathway of phenol degradation
MYNTFRAGILIICVIMLAPTTAWATRPFGVDDTGTEGAGNFLFELTGEYAKDNLLRATTESAIITAGASEHIDFSLETPYLLLNPSPVTGEFASGKGDVRIQMKQQLFENEVKQSMAYKIYTDLPSGDVRKGTGTNNVVWGVGFIDTQECHRNAFHLNVGYEEYGKDMKHWHFAKDYAFKFGLAAEHKFTESFRLVTELAGEYRKVTDEASDTHVDSRPFTFLTGFVYDISKSWYVDLGARAGLNKDADDYSVLAGTAWRF